jgi:mannose/cellobiose epimerase-like protein (N-acyl-D-glucosamine 2-epimerase family)
MQLFITAFALIAMASPVPTQAPATTTPTTATATGNTGTTGNTQQLVVVGKDKDGKSIWGMNPYMMGMGGMGMMSMNPWMYGMGY